MAASSLTAANKISPEGIMFLHKAALERSVIGEKMMNVNTPQSVKVLVALNEGATVDDFAGYDVDCVISDSFIVVNLPVDKIEEFSELDAVQRVSFGEELKPCLEKANASTGVDKVHAGSDGLPQVYDGTGVIAGIFDTGLDPNHIMFRAADGTTYRVKRFFNMTSNVTYTEDNMEKATTDKSTESHGTHCAGIMAGLGGQKGQYGGYKNIFGTTSPAKVSGAVPYTGVATGADIAMGGGTLTYSNISSGCKKVIEYAKSVGKPAVINLSIGRVVGPHDGSSDLSRALNDLSSDAIIFVAAGNEADVKCSILKKLSSSDNKVQTFISPSSTTLDANAAFWANNSTELSAKVGLYSKSKKAITKTISMTGANLTITGTSYSNPSYIHDADFNNAFTASSFVMLDKGVDKINNRAYVTVSISWTRNSSTNSNNDVVPVFIVNGAAGQTILATTSEEFSDLGDAAFDDGTTAETINDHACGKNVIAVGAYSTRNSFVTLSGKLLGYQDETMVENAAYFSSYGTTADGRNLPHICAPGFPVISAYSKYYISSQNLGNDDVEAKVTANGRDNYWGQMSGTSMACPYAAGVGALLLQVNPNLTVSEVRDILMQTATNDTHTAAGNKIQWGAGKINALQAVKKVLDMGGVGEIYADEDMRLIVTSDGGKQYNVFLAGVDAFDATVYSLAGASLNTVHIDGNEGNIDASNLASGVYVLEVKADNAHFTKKFVVK